MRKLTRLTALALAVCLLAGCSYHEQEQKKSFQNNDSVTSPAQGQEASLAETSSQATESAPPTQTTSPATETPTQNTTPTQPPSTQIPAHAAGYSAVYQDIYQLLTSGDRNQNYLFATTGIKEATSGTSTEAERFAAISYALQDLNDDGIQEMIVLDPHWTLPGNSRILALYTLQNGSPLLIDEGWARSRLYLLQDGTFYHEGSGGAAYSVFETRTLQGTHMFSTGIWFTYPKDEAQTQGGYYYNATGEYSVEASIEITNEEYTTQQEALQQKIVTFNAYSFH